MSRLEVIEASNTKQISDCLKIREEVFINEQGVPEEEELDDLDDIDEFDEDSDDGDFEEED